MKRLVRNKAGEVSYGQKWQHPESSSDSENNDDDNEDLHSSAITNQDQIPKGKRVEVTVKDGELMYLASLQGDWVAAEVLLDRDPKLAFEYVTEEGDRALHVAAAMKHKELVKKLVERMTEEKLLLLNGHGNTACCYAAISGDVETASLIIRNRPKLATARDEEKVTPLLKAALRGNGRMLSFLLGYAKDEDLSRDEWFDLLLVAIRGKMFDEAIGIMGKNGSIATMANKEEGTALHLMARVDASKKQYVVSEFRRLAKKAWGEMLKMEKASLLELMKTPVHILHDAAKAGQVEMITMLTRTYPHLIWETDIDGYTIFHLAVMHRQRAVFNLVHQVEAMLGFRTAWQDRRGNNILHLAAKSAVVTQMKLPPAYELQEELKWFQAVKEILPPSCLLARNGKGLMPEELLARTHKRLLREGQMWMINKADSSMLIVTILLTVVFAAAFTVPGGYSSQTGEPVLARKNWFKVFVVFEVLSIMFSVVSIVMFHSIIASSFELDEFLFKLPMLQSAGFQFLLMSLMGAFLAFMASVSLFGIKVSGLVWFGFAVLCVYGLVSGVTEMINMYRDMNKRKVISSGRRTLFKENVNLFRC